MTPEERADRLLAAVFALGMACPVVALDGMSASGKTTLAAQIREKTGCTPVHMDDFFLPPSLRSPDRLSQPGGNVDYERFMREVLPHLGRREEFSYRVFSCRTMSLEESRDIEPGRLILVEGAYCLHPAFGAYADLKVFSAVSPEEQKRRILETRPDRAEDFFEKWIPMENAYFEAFGIRDRADLIL